MSNNYKVKKSFVRKYIHKRTCRYLCCQDFAGMLIVFLQQKTLSVCLNQNAFKMVLQRFPVNSESMIAHLLLVLPVPVCATWAAGCIRTVNQRMICPVRTGCSWR